jgi:hypothetical protein
MLSCDPHRDATSLLCPFNAASYLAGLPHLGKVECRSTAPAAIFRRPIPNSSYCDGLGPWPYAWVDNAEELAALCDAFSDLVSLTIVTQPGFRPPRDDASYFKDHYIFDPSLGFPHLSARALKRLERAADACEFVVVTDLRGRLEIVKLYADVKRRRNLAGGFFDFPLVHFETLARHPAATFFRVRRGEDTEAMACALQFGGWIQLLHIAVSDAGLKSNASYLLMYELLRFAMNDRRLLCMGGIPQHGEAGLSHFKARWSNRRDPVYLLRIVNDRRAYASLTRSVKTAYFPAYRDDGVQLPSRAACSPIS